MLPHRLARLSASPLALPCLFLGFLFLSTGCLQRPAPNAFPSPRADETPLLLIANDHLVVGVLPSHGGRVVLLRTPSGPNLLDARPATWSRPPFTDVEALISPPWEDDLGHIVWMGPQSDFWFNQDAFPSKHERRHVWPPDPYLTQLPYAVLLHTPDRIVVRSQISPVWGVQLTKTVHALPDGTIRFEVEAYNPGPRTVTRNLWLNFRALPSGREFTPVTDSGTLSLSVSHQAEVQILHGFASTVVPPGASHRGVKTSLTPATGLIASTVPGGYLVLRFDSTPPDAVPPGQAPVEIYRVGFDHAELAPLLELEHHGPLTRLEPGQRFSRQESWAFLPAPPAPSPDQAAAELHRLLLATPSAP